MSAQLSLLEPTPCRCGEIPCVDEYPEEVRIGGWCMCPMQGAPIVSAPTYLEAKDQWEAVLCN